MRRSDTIHRMSRDKLSSDSIASASKSRVEYSGHGDAAGAAGARPDQDIRPDEFLSKRGQSKLVAPPEGGFETMTIGLAWNNVVLQRAEGLLNRLTKKVTRVGVDLDLGCLYELQDGQRGSVQAFGEMFGALDTPPYIALSGDERTGEAEGDDEVITLNGPKWPEVKRVLVYAYIYQGPTNWGEIEPDLTIRLREGEPETHIKIDAGLEDMNLCALAMLENNKNGVRVTNLSEYFPAHPAMDRAFGFGLKWADGEKD